MKEIAGFSLLSLLALSGRAIAHDATAEALASRSNRDTPRASGFREDFFDAKISSLYAEQLRVLQLEEDTKERYRLINDQDRLAYLERNTRISYGFLNESQSQFFQNSLNRMLQNESGKDSFRSSRAPVMAVGALAALTLGIPLKLKTASDSRLLFRSRAIAGQGELGFETGTLSTGIAVSRPHANDASTGGIAIPGRNPSSANEVAQLRVGKQIPELGARAGVSYGSTSDTMTASVSKTVTKQISLELDRTRETAQMTTGAWANSASTTSRKPAQDTVRLLYNLSF